MFDQGLETLRVLGGFCCISQGLLSFCARMGSVSPSGGEVLLRPDAYRGRMGPCCNSPKSSGLVQA